MSDLQIIFRSLKSRPTSSIITIALVATSVGLLLTLLTLKTAGRTSFQRGVGNAHLIVSGDASPLVAVLNGLFHLNAPRTSIPMSTVEELRESFPWKWVIPTQLGDSFQGFPVLASTPEYLQEFSPADSKPFTLADGRFPTGPLEVAFGSEVARSTGLSVGDRIHLTHGAPGSSEPIVRIETGPSLPGNTDTGEFSDEFSGPAPPPIEIHTELAPHVHEEFAFEVTGILEPTKTHHDRIIHAQLEGAWLVHALDRRELEGRPPPVGVEDLEPADELVTGVLLRTPSRPGRNSSAIVQQVFDELRRNPAFTVASPSAQIDRLFAIVSGVDAIFIAMGIAVLISSGFAVLLAMWNSMEMRRRQVAILRVLGASRIRILGLVLGESALMGMIGAGFGLVISLGGTRIASAILESRTGVVISPEIDLKSSILTVAATIVVAALAGLAPAIRAYRTPVADHLRPLG